MMTKRLREKLGSEWSVVQSFFINMGGFCVKSPSGALQQLECKDLYRELGISENSEREILNNATGPLPRPHQEWMDELTKIPSDQVEELAKTDSLAKLIACSQSVSI